MIHWARTHNGLSFFPPVLIFLRQKAESEVAQLHLRVLNLPTIHILYTPHCSLPLRAMLIFTIFFPEWYFPSLFNQSPISALPARPARLFSLLSFPSLHNVQHSTSAIIHVLTFFFFFFALVALQSGHWAIFGPADD